MAESQGCEVCWSRVLSWVRVKVVGIGIGHKCCDVVGSREWTNVVIIIKGVVM
jgi:hypothetical protein